MWKLIKIIIIVFLIVVAIQACNKAEENGKSYWYNVGQTSKNIITDIGNWFKPVADDVKKGIDE